jgi:hypothetical protein
MGNNKFRFEVEVEWERKMENLVLCPRNYLQYNKTEDYWKTGVSLGLGGGAARSTPSSLELYKTNIWYRKYLTGRPQ